jgi:very-short-patch-repair endonuclease
MPDLFLPGCGLAGEYDGELHRELRMHTDDNQREESFEDLGLIVVRATSLDVGRRRAATAERLRRAHARATDRLGPVTWLWRPSPAPRLVS